MSAPLDFLAGTAVYLPAAEQAKLDAPDPAAIIEQLQQDLEDEKRAAQQVIAGMKADYLALQQDYKTLYDTLYRVSNLSNDTILKVTIA